MSRMSARKSFHRDLSFLTVGAALSFGLVAARAGDDNVTEDQIVRALVPAKKPLTRGLSMGPQTQSIRRRSPPRDGSFRPSAAADAFAVDHRARRNRHRRQGQAEYRSRDQLRLQFGRDQRKVAALGPGARQGADQPRPEGLDLRASRAIPTPQAVKPTIRICRSGAPTPSSTIWSTSTVSLLPTS